MLRELCNVLRPDLEPHTRLRTALSIETKVTIARNFYTTGSFQSATADISNISQFSAHRSIWQVTDALYKRSLSFLMTREKQVEWQAGFVQISGFPRVQGAIDCTHFGLRAPQNHPEIFVNRKGFHSLNVQLVCDHQHRIRADNARYPGSSHDSFILRQSSVPTVFSGPNQDCGWLLGDKGYPLSTWLLTPLQNPRTAGEHAYNNAHSATRCIIEHCIGILKQRFRCLDQSGGALQYSPEWVSIFMVVCCMLHDPAVMREQPLEVNPAVPPQEEEEEKEEVQEEEEEEVKNQDIKGLDGLKRFIALGTLDLSKNLLTWKELQKIRHINILDLRLHGNPELQNDAHCTESIEWYHVVASVGYTLFMFVKEK
uniref:putative nuclease HARBI1 n=1 Tax=Pristiophorus japonicus TaxID=55135 RepID=UPI00398F7083